MSEGRGTRDTLILASPFNSTVPRLADAGQRQRFQFETIERG